VPRGSVLGPQLFVLYTAKVSDNIVSLGIIGHTYADDTQVYVSTPVTDTQQTSVRLAEYIRHLDRWMSQNGPRLNAEQGCSPKTKW